MCEEGISALLITFYERYLPNSLHTAVFSAEQNDQVFASCEQAGVILFLIIYLFIIVVLLIRTIFDMLSSRVFARVKHDLLDITKTGQT